MQNAPFYIGQKIVALKTVTSTGGSDLVKGQIYFAKDLWLCPSCKKWSVDIGKTHPVRYASGCSKCQVESERQSVLWAKASLFAPIIEGDNTKAEIDTEILGEAYDLVKHKETIAIPKKQLN